ncbi:MAG: hypothetical protein AAGE52_08835 [Myxococcota bacterium]
MTTWSHLEELLALSRAERLKVLGALQGSLRAEEGGTERHRKVREALQAGQFQQALTELDGIAKPAPSMEDQVVRARILAQMGAFEDASEVLREAHQQSTEQEDRHCLAAVELARASLASQQGQRAEHLARAERAVALFVEQGDSFRAADASLLLGFGHHELGALDLAKAQYDAARRFAVEASYAVALGGSDLYEGWLLLEDGALEAGRELLESAIARLGELNHPRHQAAGHYCLAHYFVRTDALPKAGDVIARGLSLLTHFEGATMRGLLLALQATILEGRDPVEAREVLARAAHTRSFRMLAVEVLALIPRVPSDAAEVLNALDAIDRTVPSTDVRMALGLLYPPLDAHLADAPIVRVEGNATAFRVNRGPRYSLARRHHLRRIVRCLVDTSRGWSWEALFAEAWPGEHADPRSAHRRVRTAIHELRKAGLSEVLVTGPDGYQLTATVRQSA